MSTAPADAGTPDGGCGATPGPDDAGADRRARLRAAVADVRERIAAAARDAGRDPSGIDLLAVTKTWPATDVALLHDLGVDAFGENKGQEGAAKAVELARLRPGAVPHWHMIGHLQRNKARHVARWAAAVDSVDSPRLVDALDRAVGHARDAGERTDPLAVLVQLSLDGDPGRGGAPADGIEALTARIARAEHLHLRGLMTVLPPGTEPAAGFAEAAAVAGRVRAQHPDATTFSAGMSGDLAAAVAQGSTCVRVGTALLGDRPLAFPVSE